jgi:DNA-directed RNA polymerase subunit RPC12/RpoP
MDDQVLIIDMQSRLIGDEAPPSDAIHDYRCWECWHRVKLSQAEIARWNWPRVKCLRCGGTMRSINIACGQPTGVLVSG